MCTLALAGKRYVRAETQEAMRMFLGGRCYTAKQLEKDYLSEVAGYSDDRWEAPQRAARLAAAVNATKPPRCCVLFLPPSRMIPTRI